MKQINPVLIWDNGQTIEAKVLNAYAVNVILGTSATFYYALLAENNNKTLGKTVAEGNITMTGEAYQSWTTDNVAWDWIAQQLNLTIIGDYIPPVAIISTEEVAITE